MFPVEIVITKTGERRKIATQADLPFGVAFKVVSTTEHLSRRDIRHRYVDEQPLGTLRKEHRKEQQKEHRKGQQKEHNKGRKRHNPNTDNFVVEESVQVTRSGGLYVQCNRHTN